MTFEFEFAAGFFIYAHAHMHWRLAHAHVVCIKSSIEVSSHFVYLLVSGDEPLRLGSDVFRRIWRLYVWIRHGVRAQPS